MRLIGSVYKNGKVYPLYVRDKIRYIFMDNKYKRFDSYKCYAYKIGNIVIRGGQFYD